MAHLSKEELKDFDILKFFQTQAFEYPKLGTNAGMAVYDDDTAQYKGNVGCHNYMNGFIQHGTYDWDGTGEKGLKELYTSTWAHDYTPEVLEYFRFLCNKQYSPWRSILKGSEVLWASKDGKDVPVAVKLTDMSANGKVVMNFMLALRMAYAQPGLIKSYAELRKAGFTRTESVFLSASFGVTKTNVPNWPYIGDYPYDTSFTDMDWEMWKNGKPRFPKGSALNTDRVTKPMNAIWNEDASKSSGIVVAGSKKNNNRICTLISEEKEIVNIFGQKEMRRYPLPLDQAIKKLKDNQEVWKCRPPKQESMSPVAVQPEKTLLNSTNFLLDADIQWSVPPIPNTTAYYSTASNTV